MIYYKRLKIIDKRYLIGIFATERELLLKNIGIKQINPSSATQILILETIFGVIFSIIIYSEQITTKFGIGFVYIYILKL
ncbi:MULTISPECIES: hypothetical protein [Terrisporobacter]|uniref:Uncharacterized protein n=1 Tax=Terrisporobacter othiniensis TaxID=1577792 RepID=A0A0B3VMB4_9FIRM|nr:MULTISPECIES: hypothetical protein [Terrisporobacter]KHS57936.1 hypothetical protein QX51_05415 [Terrisporobacter othiniensis]MCC3668362.1 hypothetical protein [Terrisporobacter mayombei]